MNLTIKFQSSFDVIPEVGRDIIWFNPEGTLGYSIDLKYGEVKHHMTTNCHGLKGYPLTCSDRFFTCADGKELSASPDDGPLALWAYSDEIFEQIDNICTIDEATQ